jgi:uncharacterized protein
MRRPRKFPYLFFLASLSTLLVWSDAVWIEPNWLAVERVTVSIRGLPAEFEGYTIVQLSDLHMSPAEITIQRVRKAVDSTNQLHPDLILLTGDFVTADQKAKAETVAQELGRLQALDGVYAVLGNHDWWQGKSLVVNALTQAQIPNLDNKHILLQRGDSRLYLAGVDDTWEGHENLPLALEGIPPGEVILLMAHEPDLADQVALDGRVSLQLSGHTHGGQVRIPGLPALATPRLGRKYTDGLYALGDMQLYVTRGVGVIFPPVRLFCRPEITFITLVEG